MLSHMISEYKILTPSIGEGAFGTVFLAKNANGELFAVKRINANYFQNERKTEFLKRELKILSKISHPNIIKLYDIKKSKTYINLILEHCDGGDLDTFINDYIIRFKTLPSEILIQHFTKQIISAIHHMSSLNMVHRDIKGQNIMISFKECQSHINPLVNNEDPLQILNIEKSLDCEKNILNNTVYNINYSRRDQYEKYILSSKIKIIDLGFSRILSDDGLAYSIMGTPLTMAPEIYHNKIDNQKKNPYSTKVDIWSIGCVIYFLLTGQYAFIAFDIPSLYSTITNGEYYLPENINVSVELLDLINGMLQYYADDRLSWEEILNHPFFVNDVSTFHMFKNDDKLLVKNGMIYLSNKVKYNFVNRYNIKINEKPKELIKEEEQFAGISESYIDSIFLNDCEIIEIGMIEEDDFIIYTLIES